MSTASAATAAPAKQNGANNHVAAPTPATTNGRGAKKKTAEPPAVDPVSMYESVRSRIAALEEEEGLEEEEDNRMGKVVCWSLAQIRSYWSTSTATHS